MEIAGADYLKNLAENEIFEAKMVFNEIGCNIFSVKMRHCEMGLPGVSYQEGKEGNALAAILKPHKIEIRYHENFPDFRVSSIIKKLIEYPELSFMGEWEVTYQGRRLNIQSGNE